MNIDLNNAINRFIAQLNSIEKMIEEVNKPKEKEDMTKVEFSDMVIPIFNRKFDEYFVENDIEDKKNRITEKQREKLYYFTDLLIEKNKISKKLYNSCNVYENEDKDIVISAENQYLMEYVLKKVQDSEQKSLYDREDLIYQSSIINICICLETLASEVLRDYYLNIHGGDLINNKNLTFKQLKEFGDVDDARLYLVDSEIDSIFRDSFDRWFSNLKEKLHMKDMLAGEKETIELVNELYQRRNLLVHTDGYVNDYYIRNVPEKYRKDINKGEKLIIDYEYIVNRIKQVEKLGWIIYIKYNFIIHRRDYDELFYNTNETLLKHLERNCDIIPKIFEKLQECSKNDKHCELIAQVNYYLYFKVNGRINEVKEELESIDFSMLSSNYIMAKAIILGEEDAFEKTKIFLDNIKDEEFLFVIEWPLLRIFITNEQYKEYFNKRMNKIFDIKKQEVLAHEYD